MDKFTQAFDASAHCSPRQIKVQNQARPQTARGFQSVSPLDDDACFVVDPLDRRARLMIVKVIQNRLLPALVGAEEIPPVDARVQGVQFQYAQTSGCRLAMGGGVKDLLEAHLQLVQLFQPRQALEQGRQPKFFLAR